MSARLTLEFLDDGTMTYEHRVSKDSDERTVESFDTLNYMDVRHIGVLGSTGPEVTHRVMIMTWETFEEIRRRLDESSSSVSFTYSVSRWSDE